jgi:DNA (cytosine-5)-methyltransferase 1
MMKTSNTNNIMELSTMSKEQLLLKCKELNISNYSKKNKSQLVSLIQSHELKNNLIEFVINDDVKEETYNIEDKDTCSSFNKMRMIDLFAGTGAFSYGFHNTLKVDTIFANDMLDSSEEMFNANHSIKLTKKNLIDVKESEIPEHDILTGGFPCQPFSIAGMQKGFDDERSNVFWKILSIIKYHNPKIVILENVKNLQSHDNGNTFKTIKEQLEKLDYHVKFAILNTCKLTSVPQNRERIYIACFKDKKIFDEFNFDFPSKELQPIANFLEKDIADKYYYKDTSHIYNELKENMVNHISTNTIYQYRRYYVRENKNSVCPTLTANMGTGGHNVPLILDNNGIRKLTPRECFNLQGFPKDYKLPKLSDAKLYSLAGNAVSLPIIELISNKIVTLLSSDI